MSHCSNPICWKYPFFFFSFNCPCTFVKYQLAIFLWACMWILFCLVVSVSSLSAVWHCFNYCNFKVLKWDIMYPPISFFIIIISSILVRLFFLVNFRIPLPTCRKLWWNYDWQWVQFGDQFGENWHLYCIESSNLWTWHILFFSSFISSSIHPVHVLLGLYFKISFWEEWL